MSNLVLIVNGHPDPRPERFCAALCDAYATGAEASGAGIARLDVGALDFSPPESQITPSVAEAIEKIRKADRLVIVFPLWLDGPPGSLRELFELFARSVWSSSAFGPNSTQYEKPARVVATMDMPSFMQRARSGGAALPKQSALALPGVQRSEPLFIGSLQTLTQAQREEWLEKMRLFGAHES